MARRKTRVNALEAPSALHAAVPAPDAALYRRGGVLCGGHCPLGMQMSVFSAAVHLHCSNETKLQFAAPLRP